MRLAGEKRKMLKNEFEDMAMLFNTLNKQPEHIFDCGANVGFVTHVFLKKFPTAKIHSFEPNPLVFEQLKNAHGQNPNVVLHNKGIGRTKGSLTFNINKNSGTSSFLAANAYHTLNYANKNIQEKVVEVVGIGEYMKENNISCIDLLKLDIEGFELEALKGIDDLENRVKMIYTEVNLIPTYDKQPLINDIINYAQEHKFHLFNIYGINENKYMQASITNLVFLSDSFKNELKEKVGEKYFGY
ncbi:MAG: FkbM family methyltransferase [Bacteroidota bacterium]|nr:FkbM family methyltransferase [Bacteroidota bacterium]